VLVRTRLPPRVCDIDVIAARVRGWFQAVSDPLAEGRSYLDGVGQAQKLALFAWLVIGLSTSVIAQMAFISGWWCLSRRPGSWRPRALSILGPTSTRTIEGAPIFSISVVLAAGKDLR